MKNTCISHKPGDIVQLAGIDFVVLEDRGPFNGEGENHDLFILALEGQGESGIDALAGATSSHGTFQVLAQAVVEQARKGDSSIALVDVSH